MSTDKKANASGRTAPKAHDLGKIRVGRLPTMNQDEYPGLSEWWVQLRIGEDGEEVLARVYGNTPEQARTRAATLAAQPDQTLTQQTLDDVKAGIPARDAEIAALRKEIEALQAAQAQTRPTVTAGMVMEAEAVLIRAGGTFHRQVKDAIEAALDVAQQDGQFTVQAQQPVSGADERADFEAWATHINTERHPHKPEMYHHPDANNGWAAWQARAALAHQDAPDSKALDRAQPSRNSGELPSDEELIEFATEEQFLLFCDEDEFVQIAKAVLQRFGRQGADKVDAALAEMVHAMFRSGNDVPVTRITIDRKQYEAAIEAARKEHSNA